LTPNDRNNMEEVESDDLGRYIDIHDYVWTGEDD
jgi:hypothetical protein